MFRMGFGLPAAVDSVSFLKPFVVAADRRRSGVVYYIL